MLLAASLAPPGLFFLTSTIVYPVVNSLTGSSNCVAPAVISLSVPPPPPALLLVLLTAFLAPPMMLLPLLADSLAPSILVNNLSDLQHCQAYQAWGLSDQLKIIHQNVFNVSTFNLRIICMLNIA